MTIVRVKVHGQMVCSNIARRGHRFHAEVSRSVYNADTVYVSVRIKCPLAVICRNDNNCAVLHTRLVPICKYHLAKV